MECPKCSHKIYVKLTPEELVYCPYCDQRMIPPKEFNLCPTCGGELPLGSVYCLSCSKKLTSGERSAIDQHPNQPLTTNREDIASLVNEETPAVQNTEPRSILHIIETPLPMHEDLPAEYQTVELPSDHSKADISFQQVNVEPPVVGKAPQEPIVMPTPRTIPTQFVQGEPVIIPPQDEATLQAVEDTAHILKGEPSGAQKLPELQEMSVQEVAPPHLIEEALPLGDKQPQATPIPIQEDIAQMVNDNPLGITQEPTEAGTTLHRGDTPPNGEFGFCFACGQKLPSGSSYCPRCGKSMKVHEFPSAPLESLQPSSGRHKDAVKPENEELPIIQKPLGSRAMPYPEEIPSSTNKEPAPILIRNVQPKYRPVPSRESISEAMDDRAPRMQPFPRAKASPRIPLKPVWPKIRGWLAKAISSAGDFFSRRCRLPRLFGKWVKKRDIAPEDFPSTEVLKHVTKESKAPAYRANRLVYPVLGAIVFVAFFIFIGVTMSRCG